MAICIGQYRKFSSWADLCMKKVETLKLYMTLGISNLPLRKRIHRMMEPLRRFVAQTQNRQVRQMRLRWEAFCGWLLRTSFLGRLNSSVIFAFCHEFISATSAEKGLTKGYRSSAGILGNVGFPAFWTTSTWRNDVMCYVGRATKLRRPLEYLSRRSTYSNYLIKRFNRFSGELREKNLKKLQRWSRKSSAGVFVANV